jgi:hypothetical protein
MACTAPPLFLQVSPAPKLQGRPNGAPEAGAAAPVLLSLVRGPVSGTTRELLATFSKNQALLGAERQRLLMMQGVEGAGAGVVPQPAVPMDTMP